MAIKISKVLIKNFRLFKDFLIDFDAASFVIFDGPNGYGKTSFYDAMELFFTGRNRRFNELAKFLDQRETFAENPYLNKFSEQGDLIIKMELEIDGNRKILLRKGKRDELKAKTRINDLDLTLYELKNFDENSGTQIKDENVYLTQLLGENYCENFQFLNYIEQEENIALLKSKDKDRRNAIEYLFNTLDFQLKLEKIACVYGRVRDLCGKSENDRLKALKEEVSKLKQEFSGIVNEVKYLTLFPSAKFDWDDEDINFKAGQLAELVGKDGLLENLKKFVLNFEDFKNDLNNTRLDKMIENEEYLKNLLLYYNSINELPVFENKLKRRRNINALLSEYRKGALKVVLEKSIDLADLSELVENIVDINSYEDLRHKILKTYDTMNSFSGIITSLQDARNAFVRNFELLEKQQGGQKECPFCGFNWQSSEELKSKLKEQEAKMSKLVKDAGAELSNLLEQFRVEFINPIQTAFEAYLKENQIDESFVKNLQKAAKLKVDLNKLYNDFLSIGVDLSSYMTQDIIKVGQMISVLKSEIKNRKKVVNIDRISPNFADYFFRYFNQREEAVKKISCEDIDNKISYIKWKFSIFQNQLVKEKISNLEKQSERFEQAKELTSRLKKLKEIYDGSLSSYQKTIIGDIEILFHIYSGRIIQDCQGGMGLFISDKSGIRFLEDPAESDSHDALFTMSSGQLAVLIIAFTLTLNKKYSQNKLLFIDDPVQTLDELNLSSLIELLRNEFSDRQIFMSTHEDKMSVYMRYKFEKFRFKTARLNFKDRYFSPVKSNPLESTEKKEGTK